MEDSWIIQRGPKAGQKYQSRKMSEATGRTELKHRYRLWGVGGRTETEGLADRRVLLTQAKFMPVNDTERRLWMKTRFNRTCQIFPVFQCNLSHFPHSCRSNAASSPLGAWLGRRAHPGKEMGEDTCKLTFLPKEGKQSLQWDCQCKGNRPETEQRGLGGWVWGFFPFSFFSQTFYLLSKVYSGCPKLPINLLKYFHQKLFLFTQVIHLKKMPWNTKTEFFFKLYFSPPPVCPVNWKKINYMLILSHRSEKPRWGLMELTPFFNFQLCARSSISVTPTCVSSLQEYLHHHSKGKLPPILTCIHQH